MGSSHLGTSGVGVVVAVVGCCCCGCGPPVRRSWSGGCRFVGLGFLLFLLLLLLLCPVGGGAVGGLFLPVLWLVLLLFFVCLWFLVWLFFGLFCFVFFFCPACIANRSGSDGLIRFFSIEDWPRARLAVGSIGGGTKK